MISLVRRLLRPEEEEEEEVAARLSTSVLMIYSATLKMILEEILSTTGDILIRNKDTVSLTLKTFSMR
jgi:hypothetical protein